MSSSTNPNFPPAGVYNQNFTRNSDTSHTVTWTNNEDPDLVSAIRVERWDNVSRSWTVRVNASKTAQSYTDTGTVAGRRYRWRIRPYNSAGLATPAYTDGAQTTPAAPTTAAITAAPSGAISITWQNKQSGTDYKYVTAVEESVNGGAFAEIAEFAEGITGYTRTGLTPGNTYQYRVRARAHVKIDLTFSGETPLSTATVASGYSTSSSLLLLDVPNPVTAMSVSRSSDTSHTLSWTNNPTSARPYDSLSVERWDSSSNAWTAVATLGPTATSLNDTGTVANRKYQWRVTAINSIGSSTATASSFAYTTPDAPTGVSATYTGGTNLRVQWANAATHTDRTTEVRWYKDGVLQAGTQSLAAAATSYNLSATITSAYKFEVRAVNSSGGLASAWVMSNEVLGAAPPNAPTTLAPNGQVVDLARTVPLSWVHSPSQDGSGQSAYQIQHRALGSGTWTVATAVTSTTQGGNAPWATNTYPNGTTVEWQVRTYGIHASPGAWSATATLIGSGTPTINLTSPATAHGVSNFNVQWSYLDPEGTAQAAYEIRLYDAAGTTLIEGIDGVGAASSHILATTAEDDTTYKLTFRAQDQAGLWSDLITRTINVNYVPPAESVPTIDYDADTGVVVITLTKGVDDGGVTTVPAIAATVWRRVYDPEAETFGWWEIIAENVEPDATIIDTTAPIHQDGQYRVTTYSATPSSYTPPEPAAPATFEDKWLYVSGGTNFTVVARMWANIEIGWSASRDKALYYFAGRKQPVLYTGERFEKTLNVSGLVPDGDGSAPAQWMKLAQQPGAVLLRAPGNRRIFGALSEVKVDLVRPGLHKVSFSIQETYKP